MEVTRMVKAPLEEDAAPAAAVNQDGSLMATANLSGDISLWSGVDGRCKSLKGHTKRVLCMKFNPIGDTLCSGSADGSIIVWSTVTEESMQVCSPIPPSTLCQHAETDASQVTDTWLAAGGILHAQ